LSSESFFRLLFTCINIRAIIAMIREMMPKMTQVLSLVGVSVGPPGVVVGTGVLTYLTIASISLSGMPGNAVI